MKNKSIWIQVLYSIMGLIAMNTISCANKDTNGRYTVAFQHGFYPARVQLWADDHLSYKGKVTTNSCIGLAHLIDNVGPCTNIVVKIRCDDGTEVTDAFRPDRKAGGFIDINFDHVEKKVYFTQRKKSVIYY